MERMMLRRALPVVINGAKTDVAPGFVTGV